MVFFTLMDSREMQAKAWASRQAKLTPERLKAELSAAGRKGGSAGLGKRKPRKNSDSHALAASRDEKKKADIVQTVPPEKS